MLTFDPELHKYEWNGSPVPSVTQILGVLKDRSWANGEDAMRLGTAVHYACELHDMGELDESTVSPLVQPYLDGWRRFLSESKAGVMAVEQRIYNERLGYAGTFDRILRINGKDTLVDIKTGAVYPFHGPQTAAYELAYHCKANFAPLHRASVYLSPYGGYRMEPHNSPRDLQVFLACLAVWNFKNGR
jgi:hypothetical protein